MASLPRVRGVWKDESSASLQTCQFIMSLGEVGRDRQPVLVFVDSLEAEELGGEVKRSIWRRNIVCDSGMAGAVWEWGEAAQLLTRAQPRSSRWDFVVLIRARLWGTAARGVRLPSGKIRERDARGEFRRNLKSWRKAQARGGHFRTCWVVFLQGGLQWPLATTPGSNWALKPQCVSYGTSLSRKWEGFFLIPNQITGNIVKIAYLGDFVVSRTTRIILSPLKYWLPVTWPAAIKQWKNKQKSQLREFGN